MAPPKNPSSDDPFDTSGPAAKKPAGIDNIVNELRNVLSGLGNSKPADPISEPPFQEEEFLRSPQPIKPTSDLESEKLGEAAFRQAMEPEPAPPPMMAPPPTAQKFTAPEPQDDANSDHPSDAEFWNGNVLGWPSETPESEQIEDSPFAPPPQDVPQIFSAPPAKKESSPKAPVSKNSDFDMDMDLPPMPPPPGGFKNEPARPEQKIEFESFNDFSNDPAAEESEKEDPVGDFMGGLHVPVPGTLHQIQSPTKKTKNNSDLEEMDIKPSNHIQLACFFPEGNDQIANDFLYKLKTAAAKTPDISDIEVSLQTPWFPSQVNPTAWRKAAAVSGAHMLVILAAKKDKDLFKEAVKTVTGEDLKVRVVFIEQIPLRTLYADLLAEMMRGFHAKD